LERASPLLILRRGTKQGWREDGGTTARRARNARKRASERLHFGKKRRVCPHLAEAPPSLSCKGNGASFSPGAMARAGEREREKRMRNRAKRSQLSASEEEFFRKVSLAGSRGKSSGKKNSTSSLSLSSPTPHSFSLPGETFAPLARSFFIHKALSAGKFFSPSPSSLQLGGKAAAEELQLPLRRQRPPARTRPLRHCHCPPKRLCGPLSDEFGPLKRAQVA
jgi:hypothetical protein